MAGRKQHFIPRHFLKEFVTPDGSDKHWLYRRGAPGPVPVSRNDAAATRDFYSRPATTDAPTLDDLITEYERELKYLVDEARAVPVGKTLPAPLMSEIVAHLTIRAAYLREFVEAGASEVISSIDALINGSTSLFDGIETVKHRVPPKFEKIAIEQFERHLVRSFTNLSPKAFVRLLYQIVREDYGLFQKVASDEFTAFVDRLRDEFQMMTKNSHAQVLRDDLVPSVRKAMLEKFQWQVVNFPPGDAVLPDCVALAEDAEGWGPYVLAEQKTTTRVVIPLTSSTLAVGSTVSDWEEVKEIFNLIARESCFTFYLASRKEAVKDAHLAELGSPARANISKITSSALRKAVQDFVGDEFSTEKKQAKPVRWADLATGDGHMYSVSFRDFGDLVFAEKVAESINEVVKSIGRYLPANQLDGITFAMDYAMAATEFNIELGLDDSIDPSFRVGPNGIATMFAVRRDHRLKTHIFLRGYIAEDLISEDQVQRGEAVSILVYCLGVVSFNALVEGKFPAALYSTYSDAYDGWLYRYNDQIFATYFATRLVIAKSEMSLDAAPKKEILEFYSEQALLQLEKMSSVTKEAHVQYHEGSDHNRFFEICAVHISDFMTAMAKFFAARASMIGPHRLSNPLDLELTRLKLLKWSKLFEDDLAAFERRLEDWTDLDELFFLNRHFERLLYEVGLLPDQTKDGSLYIHVNGEHRLSSQGGIEGQL